MAVYKVPQDVEADDKLLGPFSFKQFIYLIIVALSIGMAYLLSKIFIGLIIIPLPFTLFFGMLALPLKKDQPMETYLGALFSFYFIKPRKRFWVPDGINELVEITAPKNAEIQRTKDINSYEAQARLGYLTDIVESRGWAVRGAGVPTHGITSMNYDSYQEAQNAEDVMDETGGATQNFDRLIKQKDTESKTQLKNNMKQQSSQVNTQEYTNTFQDNSLSEPPASNIQYNPYPNEIKQSIIQPNTNTPNQPEQNTSVNQPSPDIIKLANDSDGLTIASVASQAHRIDSNKGGNLPNDEVDIKLR